MSERTKNNLLRQGTILAIAGLIVRLIGMIYRIPVGNIIGDEGNGVYAAAFNIYNLALIISSYGLPMAVSKMISASLAKNEYKKSKKILVASLSFACVVGGVVALALFLGADFLARYVYSGYAGIELPFRVLAPTVFIVAILGVVRGFFQGHGNMVPTAISQIFEQIVNAVVSIGAAWILMKEFGKSTRAAGYGAMGSTMGTCFGALTALVVVGCWYLKGRKKFLQNVEGDEASEDVPYPQMYRLILATTLPIILGQTFYQISAVFDDILFGKILAMKGFGPEYISSRSGVYNSIYVLMISIPMGVATALASSSLPSIVHSFTQKRMSEVYGKINSVMKFNMMIAIPSSVGLFILGEPVISLLFPRLDYVTGGAMLRLGSLAVIFYAISTITSSILQSLDQMMKPVIHSAISLVIHLVLVSVLLVSTDLDGYALVIGYMTFPVVVGGLNLYQIRKSIGYRMEVKRTFLLTGLCALFMGLCTFAVYYGLVALAFNHILTLGIALVVAVVTYFGPMMAFHNIERI
ncbi:MAG: polysaccharide biosynthesis protein [Lachnospiraceae bacterium]|nr:polysaccharide biosynthesis protein [Lachnospiraceae bacterium]